jgi:ubiquinone/menaquinone biosynthesis C-methylase UbiE
VAKHRQDLLSNAHGEILEIGFGTGLNLPHYPEPVRKITVVDPNPHMHRKALRRMGESRVEVDHRQISSERLPFDDGAFETVVSTFTLCSIDDVGRAVGEIFRVLKPGGQFLVLEHGLSAEPGVQKWQHRLNGLQQMLADGCRLNRDVRAIVSQQPFARLELSEFYLEQTPRTHGYLYLGAATK